MVVTAGAGSSALAYDKKKRFPAKAIQNAAKRFLLFLAKECVDLVNAVLHSGKASL